MAISLPILISKTTPEVYKLVFTHKHIQCLYIQGVDIEPEFLLLDFLVKVWLHPK